MRSNPASKTPLSCEEESYLPPQQPPCPSPELRKTNRDSRTSNALGRKVQQRVLPLRISVKSMVFGRRPAKNHMKPTKHLVTLAIEDALKCVFYRCPGFPGYIHSYKRRDSMAQYFSADTLHCRHALRQPWAASVHIPEPINIKTAFESCEMWFSATKQRQKCGIRMKKDSHWAQPTRVIAGCRTFCSLSEAYGCAVAQHMKDTRTGIAKSTFWIFY